MKDLDILEKNLSCHFKIKNLRLRFITFFISALFMARTVNLTRIANFYPGAALVESKYRKIQRFFALYALDLDLISKFLIKMVPHSEECYYITIDRTNWKFGIFNINLLVLGIAHDGISFPILWIMLDKKGNSNTSERIELINKFIKFFDPCKIKCILCDREFVGKKWFKYLVNDVKISFRIRVKDCYKINKKDGKLAPLKNFFRNLKPGEEKILDKQRCLWGIWLYIVGVKTNDGELVVIVTDKNPETAARDYLKRWGIEVLFKCLKTGGFNFEDTHLKDRDRISKLMGLLAIAFCWAYLVGDFNVKRKAIKIKKHGRKAVSVFRVGLDILTRTIFCLTEKIKEFKVFASILSCT
jgi:hypothetical protein